MVRSISGAKDIPPSVVTVEQTSSQGKTVGVLSVAESTRKVEDISGASVKNQKLEPISLQEAKEKVKAEMNSLFKACQKKLTFCQKLEIKAYHTGLKLQIGLCGTKEKLRDLLNKQNEKINELSHGKSEDDTRLAATTQEKIKTLVERLATK
jgi:hypothetical protein